MSFSLEPTTFPILPTPVTIQFKDQESAVETIVGFKFEHPRDTKMPGREGWIVVRIEEQLGIVEARFCPACIGWCRSQLSREDILLLKRLHSDPLFDVEVTLNDWRENFFDCLVMKLLEPPSTHKPLELLQSQLAGVPNYFAELRVMRGKAIPWPQQEFMDVEAILAGLADPRMSRTRTSYYYLYSYARKQLERAAHAGREPEEIENVQQSIKKLKDFGYAAASTATWVKYDEEAWLKRMQTECPGFSDWVYKGAIHDYGSFYAQ